MSDIGLAKAELDTPALWVDLAVLEQNIARLAAYFKAAGVQWRPHTKGIKVPAIAHKLVAAGAIGVTCAKLGEAEVMAAAGIRDILVANEIVGPRKAARVAAIQRHADVKVAVDSEANAAELGAAARAAGVVIGVLVEVDTGMHRAGVLPGAAAVALAQRVQATAGLRFDGLMAWEGHAVAMVEGSAEKQREIERAVGLLVDSAAQCRAAGLPVRIVSGGGSGTYKVTAHIAGMTEIQAGGAIFADASYQKWGVEASPALFVRTTVTSRPAPDRIIFDFGFKSLPTHVTPPQPLGLAGVQSVGASAEHGTVKLAAPSTTVQVGDQYDFIVGYGDATVFLYDKLYGIRNGVVETVWDVQGRGKVQ